MDPRKIKQLVVLPETEYHRQYEYILLEDGAAYWRDIDNTAVDPEQAASDWTQIIPPELPEVTVRNVAPSAEL